MALNPRGGNVLERLLKMVVSENSQGSHIFSMTWPPFISRTTSIQGQAKQFSLIKNLRQKTARQYKQRSYPGSIRCKAIIVWRHFYKKNIKSEIHNLVQNEYLFRMRKRITKIINFKRLRKSTYKLQKNNIIKI